MIERTIVLVALILLGLMHPVTGADTVPRPGFVRRHGTGFTCDGRPFAFVGANTHYLPWASRAEVDRTLEEAAKLGFTVIRTIVPGIIGSPDGKGKRTIWSWPNASDSSNLKLDGVHYAYWDTAAGRMAFNDGPDGFQRLDYVIRKAGACGLKLDIALMDYWHYTGGTRQMVSWYRELDVPGQDLVERYEAFYTDERTRADYRRLVEHVLTRRNSLTGVVYRDDPIIAAWDLMNEPEFRTVPIATEWITTMSAHVKTIDPNHLLTTGSEGFFGGRAGSDPEAHLALPTIDFGTWHTYPAYHKISPDDVIALMERHAAVARKVGKPVVLQEFGYNKANADHADVHRRWLAALNRIPDTGGWLVWRLTTTMDHGRYPRDAEGFDIHADGGPVAQAFAEAAQARRKVLSSIR